MLKIVRLSVIFLSLIGSTAQSQIFEPATLIESSVSTNHYEGIWPSTIASGVVELVFIVDKAGKPTEVEALRSSQVYFEESAIKTIHTYQYQPASLDGEPVESRQTARVVFDHSKIANISGFINPMDAPEGYMSLYNRLRKELKKEQPSHRKAMITLNKIHRLRYKTFFTGVHTQLARYYMAVEFGSKQEQLDPLLKAMMFEDIVWGGNQALDTATKNILQVAILKLMLELGYNAEAKVKYVEFQKTNPEIQDMFSGYMQQVDKLQQSDSVLERRITLSRNGNAFIALLKRSFLVELMKGSIDNFLIRCERRFARFNFDPEAQYDIPAAWGECDIQLNGDPETQLSVLQQ